MRFPAAPTSPPLHPFLSSRNGDLLERLMDCCAGGRGSVRVRTVFASVSPRFRALVGQGTRELRLHDEPVEAMLSALASCAGSLRSLRVSACACERLYTASMRAPPRGESLLPRLTAALGALTYSVKARMEPLDELKSDGLADTTLAVAVVWLANLLAASAPFTSVDIAWLHVADIHAGEHVTRLIDLLRSWKARVDDAVRFNFVNMEGDQSTAAVDALLPHPVRRLSVMLGANSGAEPARLLRSTRAPHVLLLSFDGFPFSAELGRAIASNPNIRRVDVFFTVLTRDSLLFFRALCAPNRDYPDGLLLGDSLCKKDEDHVVSASFAKALRRLRVGTSLGINFARLHWSWGTYNALQTLLLQSPGLNRLALTLSSVDCELKDSDDEDDDEFEHTLREFVLRVPPNVTAVSLVLGRVELFGILRGAAFEGVETLEVRAKQCWHDNDAYLHGVREYVTTALEHVVHNAPRLRELVLRLGGRRDLLLHGVLRTLARGSRDCGAAALRRVVVDFDLVELEVRADWQAAARAILADARPGTRWELRVRENEMETSEIAVAA